MPEHAAVYLKERVNSSIILASSVSIISEHHHLLLNILFLNNTAAHKRSALHSAFQRMAFRRPLLASVHNVCSELFSNYIQNYYVQTTCSDSETVCVLIASS